MADATGLLSPPPAPGDVKRQSFMSPDAPGVGVDKRKGAAEAHLPPTPFEDAAKANSAEKAQAASERDEQMDSSEEQGKKSLKRKLAFARDEQDSPSKERGKRAKADSAPRALTERQQMALLLKMDQKASNKAQADDKVHGRNERGETPLHRACIRGDYKAAQGLIQKGAEVNSRDNAGWTPLHEAANHGHAMLVALLLRSGADANSRGLDGDTALHDASVNNHTAVAKVLVSFGADVSLTNDHGRTALDVAPSEEMVAVLQGKERTIAPREFAAESGESAPSAADSALVTAPATERVARRRRLESTSIDVSGDSGAVQEAATEAKGSLRRELGGGKRSSKEDGRKGSEKEGSLHPHRQRSHDEEPRERTGKRRRVEGAEDADEQRPESTSPAKREGGKRRKHVAADGEASLSAAADGLGATPLSDAQGMATGTDDAAAGLLAMMGVAPAEEEIAQRKGKDGAGVSALAEAAAILLLPQTQEAAVTDATSRAMRRRSSASQQTKADDGTAGERTQKENVAPKNNETSLRVPTVKVASSRSVGSMSAILRAKTAAPSKDGAKVRRVRDRTDAKPSSGEEDAPASNTQASGAGEGAPSAPDSSIADDTIDVEAISPPDFYADAVAAAFSRADSAPTRAPVAVEGGVRRVAPFAVRSRNPFTVTWESATPMPDNMDSFTLSTRKYTLHPATAEPAVEERSATPVGEPDVKAALRRSQAKARDALAVLHRAQRERARLAAEHRIVRLYQSRGPAPRSACRSLLSKSPSDWKRHVDAIKASQAGRATPDLTVALAMLEEATWQFACEIAQQHTHEALALHAAQRLEWAERTGESPDGEVPLVHVEGATVLMEDLF